MTDKVYRQAFQQAKTDLERAVTRRLQAERDAIEAANEALHLRRTVVALAPLCGENVEDSMGLTEAVRAAIGGGWKTLAGLKSQVEQLGVSLADLKNPDASVLSVLNRLVASKEFELGTGKQGGTDVKIWRKTQSSETEDDIPF